MPSVSSEVVSSESNLVTRQCFCCMQYRERVSERGHGPENKPVDSTASLLEVKGQCSCVQSTAKKVHRVQNDKTLFLSKYKVCCTAASHLSSKNKIDIGKSSVVTKLELTWQRCWSLFLVRRRGDGESLEKLL